ncbi:hypothetical protein GCM10020219_008900 [Nonomuraea dietziae]
MEEGQGGAGVGRFARQEGEGGLPSGGACVRALPEGPGEVAAGFGEAAAQEPVPGEGVDEAVGVVGGGVVEGGAEIGALGVEGGQPLALARAAQVRVGLFGERGVVGGVALADGAEFARFAEAFEAVGLDRLQEAVARAGAEE